MKVVSKTPAMFVFLALVWPLVCGQTPVPDSLELVQILYRHGDRSPNHPFPNDVNNDYWIDGWGELTNIGKQQHLALGRYIRQRYTGFLSERYENEEIFVRSTDKPRVLMSAYCNLAGLYPPAGDQIWDEAIAWQPIAVHTKPEDTDYIVDPDFYCPKDAAIFEAVTVSPPVEAINAENQEMFEFLTNETGYNVTDLFSCGNVFDDLICDKSHNLTLPYWADDLWDQMSDLYNLRYYYEYGIPELCRLSGGPLVGHMIENMNSKIAGSIDDQRAYVFSSHDTKIIAFLSVLGAWDGISPLYAATVFVELHKLANGDHGVQILYRNDTTVEPYVLTVAGCATPCPISDFITLTKDGVPEDIEKECFLIEPPSGGKQE